MMVKAVNEGRMRTTEGIYSISFFNSFYLINNLYLSFFFFLEVHLYMIILLKQNKTKEALEVLESLKDDLVQKCENDTEMIHIRNDLLLKTDNWTKAIDASKSSLEVKYVDKYISNIIKELHNFIIKINHKLF